MSSLYIIGNGFDLQHGLHTSYWDYRCFLCENYPQTLLDFEYFPTINKDKKELWSDVKANLFAKKNQLNIEVKKYGKNNC